MIFHFFKYDFNIGFDCNFNLFLKSTIIFKVYVKENQKTLNYQQCNTRKFYKALNWTEMNTNAIQVTDHEENEIHFKSKTHLFSNISSLNLKLLLNITFLIEWNEIINDSKEKSTNFIETKSSSNSMTLNNTKDNSEQEERKWQQIKAKRTIFSPIRSPKEDKKAQVISNKQNLRYIQNVKNFVKVNIFIFA